MMTLRSNMLSQSHTTMGLMQPKPCPGCGAQPKLQPASLDASPAASTPASRAPPPPSFPPAPPIPIPPAPLDASIGDPPAPAAPDESIVAASPSLPPAPAPLSPAAPPPLEAPLAPPVLVDEPDAPLLAPAAPLVLPPDPGGLDVEAVSSLEPQPAQMVRRSPPPRPTKNKVLIRRMYAGADWRSKKGQRLEQGRYDRAL